MSTPSNAPEQGDAAKLPHAVVISPEIAGNPTNDQMALATAVRELEAHVASGGWDGPIRLFALVHTAAAVAENPELKQQLPAEVLAIAAQDPRHLTSIEQEGLSSADSLEEMLAQVAWPPSVDGTAVVVERVVVPPEVETDMPTDPAQALSFIMGHPKRQDVRLAVGVLRDGTTWCAIRTKAYDQEAAVAGGADLVPTLIDALRATLG